MKRLFLFAFYDPQGIVGEAALRYLEALRGLGDIVLATDCDLLPGEAEKLAPLVVSYQAARHGEYDFGSYKRAFRQADLSGYDVVYLVNDSQEIQGNNCTVYRMPALWTRICGQTHGDKYVKNVAAMEMVLTNNDKTNRPSGRFLNDTFFSCKMDFDV